MKELVERIDSCLPEGFRFDEDRNWWANEANDVLAKYNHPTATSLGLPFKDGGFGDAEAPEGYLRHAVWLARLGSGYALALGYLAQVLGTEADIDSRLVSALPDTSRAGQW